MTTSSDRTSPTGGFADTVRDILSVKRVFGEAYERDGKLVIPVAKIWGGLGQGEATGDVGGKGSARFGRAGGAEEAEPREPGMSGSGQASGGGGGFGVIARPAGVYVVDGEEVYWQPAISVNQLAWVLGAVAAVGALMAPCVIRAIGKLR